LLGGRQEIGDDPSLEPEQESLMRQRSSGRSAPRNSRSHARIAVKVQPGASRDRLVGKTGDEWKIALTAPPVEGRANRACTEFLARLLEVPRSAVTIVRGETSRRKLIQIEGMLPIEVESKLDHAARDSA
jgi:uncharacterized protein